MKNVIKIAVTGFAASELDIAEEVAEIGDATYRLVAQWTGKRVVAFDKAHAAALSSIACEWSNDIDREIEAGDYDDCEVTKRQMRAAMQGLSTLAYKLGCAAN